MSNVALRVEGLGKKYRIGTHQPYNRLSEVMTGLGKSVIDLPRTMLNKSKPVPQVAEGDSNEFWALKDISFEVQEGDVVGIIGRNGAGKSTLLKILSRITEPTEGRFGVRGRISSLLEVGTGFHPELTGRENIYLSGSVLGMTRSEIKNHFDEIVDFSGVEKFLDTPVKRYSSGMQVRLGFAVAAHLKSEILIIDEVLAVGDVEFQKKCMGKMSDVARGGRTILLVSHNYRVMYKMANVVIWLNNGKLKHYDQPDAGITAYLTDISHRNRDPIASRSNNETVPVIEQIELVGCSEGIDPILESGNDVEFNITITNPLDDSYLDYIVIGISDAQGTRITTIGTHQLNDFKPLPTGVSILTCEVRNLYLPTGRYTVLVALGNKRSRNEAICNTQALSFWVDSSNFFQSGESILDGQGYLLCRSSWKWTQ
ncbi:MAG: hypothetical protein CMN21_05815 [Rubinisphaera sp.]|uniref:ABC transporter ATP-binding protein n=2 Tax=Rubinisphaera TaxID=1649490 RepID=UPI000C106077|nr:hypothetical protein [Rubinisphaera sp.]|tara:strand:+ start:2137 stop:3417 length:1281 start_codon:yes stop_codon:yes gene_type:complete